MSPGRLTLFNHFIRPIQDGRRDRDAELHGRLEVNDQLELRWPLYRQVGWLGPFEDFVHVDGGTSE